MSEREHTMYMDDMGNPDECVEDCPACHWEGNRHCEAITSGCDICDPDGVYAYAPENAEKMRRIREFIGGFGDRGDGKVTATDELWILAIRKLLDGEQ